jgi:hypothetical protein
LFSDQAEFAASLAEGINHVSQTAESIHVGPPEVSGFSISKHEEWIVVSW